MKSDNKISYTQSTGVTDRRVIDVFPFYNELDLLELRLRTLYDHVDFFVLSECEETFSGKQKPMYYAENKKRFAAFEDKIIYNAIDKSILTELKGDVWKDYVTPLDAMRAHKHNNRPPRDLLPSLRREITHRDACVKGLEQVAKSSDLILLSDVDELPNVSIVDRLREGVLKQPLYFQMRWFLYYMNNMVDAPWFGTVAFTYDMLKGQSLDLLRYASSDSAGVPGPVIMDGGWHFSYLGGGNAIQEKLDALPYQGVRAEIAKILSRLRPGAWQKKIDKNTDILLQGRLMKTVAIDQSFPKYLVENLDKYKSYIKACAGDSC